MELKNLANRENRRKAKLDEELEKALNHEIAAARPGSLKQRGLGCAVGEGEGCEGGEGAGSGFWSCWWVRASRGVRCRGTLAESWCVGDF